MKNKLEFYFIYFSLVLSALFIAPSVFADIPSSSNILDGGGIASEFHRCMSGYYCNNNELLIGFLLVIGIYLIATLLIEIPVFLLFGFRKKALLLAIIANIITVPLYQITNIFLGGALNFNSGPGSWLIAEFFIITFECLFLIIFLKKQMNTKKIVKATILANVASILVGVIIYIAINNGILFYIFPSKSFGHTQILPFNFPSSDIIPRCIPGPGVIC